MATVKPFKAWRFDSSKINHLENVIVPPYDVISEKELAEMDKLSPFNFSKVILAKGDKKHLRAAELFKSWQKEEVLIQDKTPGFYLYKQEFNLDRFELFCQKITDGHALVRYGFFAKVQVEDYANGVILPHEKTFAKYKADRYELMEAAQGNMEPVFLGYDSNFLTGEDFEKAVTNLKPVYFYEDRSGVQHKLWYVSAADVCSKIEKALQKEKLYILDGHHRYETALKFHQDHGGERTKYVLANVCAFNQPGTVILPTHRLLKDLPDFSKDRFIDLLKKNFDVNQVVSLGELETKLKGSKKVGFGLRFGGDKSMFFAELKKDPGILDLDYLHETLFKEIGGGKEFATFYVKSIPEFQERLDHNEYEVGFLVRPNTYDDVIKKASHQEVMPHKSTFFYPKIPSGLVIHQFE